MVTDEQEAARPTMNLKIIQSSVDVSWLKAKQHKVLLG